MFFKESAKYSAQIEGKLTQTYEADMMKLYAFKQKFMNYTNI
jgi:hypothetical protein